MQYSKKVEDAFSNAIKVLAPFKRTAYLPVTKLAGARQSSDSKFGGLPYLRHPEDWPICPNCHQPMPLLLQLNQATLPVEPEESLIQLFYCLDGICEYDLKAQAPFSKASVCRIIETNGLSTPYLGRLDNTLNENTITGWITHDDYPDVLDYQQLGIDLDISYESDLYQLMVSRNELITSNADKLMGWPYWLEKVDYVCDRVTGRRMDLLFQIATTHNISLEFGVLGVAHLNQSSDNENEMSFSWNGLMD